MLTFGLFLKEKVELMLEIVFFLKHIQPTVSLFL